MMKQERRKRYFKTIERESISLFFSGHAPQKTGDQNYYFSVNRNFYYLSGINQANSALVLIHGTQDATHLFIDGYDPVKALWDGETLSFEKAAEIVEIPLENVHDINTLDQFLLNLLSTSRKAIYGSLNKLYLDLERQHLKASDTEAQKFASKMQMHYPFLSIQTNQMQLAELRMVKDDSEIEAIKEAILITDKALNHVLSTLKDAKTEYEIEAEYNYILNKHHTITSFDTIAASGKNATVLHYSTNHDHLNPNDLILFDLGVLYQQYASDISRTYPVSGKFSERQKAIYEIVLRANKETISWVKPGITMQAFNEYGKKILIDGAKKIGLIKEDHEISKYYYHSLGHYLGLDVHDVGNYTKPIPVGAVVTVEPGLYIAEEGIGIRIEDDILITEDGAINLSEALIKEISDIEKAMKK